MFGQGLNNVLLNSEIVWKSKVLVNAFGFTKTCFVSARGASQNFFTKTVFFLSHEPKLRPKLVSPIRDKNSQNIAYWYKTYI
jgi:hypothetical protein